MVVASTYVLNLEKKKGSKPEKSQVAEPDFLKIRIEGADYKVVGELFVE